jgi:hypothetical protein
MRSLAVVFASACMSYAPGSFHSYSTPFASTRATVGCLDVSVERGLPHDDKAPVQGPVITVTFGNRCDHRVGIALANLRVAGDGVDLVPYDPKHELRNAALGSGDTGRESIEYRGIASDRPVCVDVGRLDSRAPSAESWVCP